MEKYHSFYTLEPRKYHTLGQYKIYHDYPKSASLVFCHDYIIFTNLSANQLPWLNDFVPESLKDAISSNWRYYIHSNVLQKTITHSKLQQRVMGGKLLAYQYTEKMLPNGQPCIYLGILPTTTLTPTLENDTHKKCMLSHDTNNNKPIEKVWLRELIISLIYIGECYDCIMLGVNTCKKWCILVKGPRNLKLINVCQRNINWTRIYIFMGNVLQQQQKKEDLAATTASSTNTPSVTLKNINDVRCPVCRQCIDCQKAITFCRKHRTCKHIQNTMPPITIGKLTIKPCKVLEYINK